MFGCKKFFGVTKKTPNCLIYSEVGRYPLYIESTLRAVKYWIRIVNMDCNRLPKLALMREVKEAEKTNNWALNIKKVLDKYGFGYVWNENGTLQGRGFLKALKERMVDVFRQELNDK